MKKSEVCPCDSGNVGTSSDNLVTSFCRHCNEDLCDVCVGAHKRVKLTKNHDIFKVKQNNAMRVQNPLEESSFEPRPEFCMVETRLNLVYLIM